MYIYIYNTYHAIFTEWFTSLPRKRCIKYGRVQGMDVLRLTKKIIYIINGARQFKLHWILDTKQDLNKVNIELPATVRTTDRQESNKYKILPKKPTATNTKLKNAWTDERPLTGEVNFLEIKRNKMTNAIYWFYMFLRRPNANTYVQRYFKGMLWYIHTRWVKWYLMFVFRAKSRGSSWFIPDI